MARTILFQKLRRILYQASGHSLNQIKVEQASKIPKYKRRNFLKISALAGGTAIATTAVPLIKAAQSQSTPPKIAIVGGGIAGLNAAYQLKKAGLKATVYEAKSRLGGRIHSVTGAVGDGLVLDLGGSFINTSHEDMLTLVEEFDLSLFNRVEAIANSPFPAEGYYFDGRLHPEAEVAEKLRPIARQIFNDADLLEQDAEQYALLDRLSVAQYLSQHADKISEPYIKVLLENSIRTEYGVEPESSSALHLIYNLATVEGDKAAVIAGNDETYVVKGGSGKIIDSLVAALPQQIQTKKRLQALKANDDGYQLTFSDRTVVDADYVVVAIPLAVLRKVDLQVELEPKFRKFIQEVNLGQNEKAFAGFENRVWLQKQGFAGGAWSDLGFSSLYDGTKRQSDRQNSALNFFMGSKEVAAMNSQSISALQQTYLENFERIIPQAKSAATGKFMRTNWGQDPLVGGGYTNFKPGQYTEFSEFLYIESEILEERQNVAFGNLIFAGEHFSDEYYGYMNGGAQTGRLAAQVLATKVSVAKQ